MHVFTPVRAVYIIVLCLPTQAESSWKHRKKTQGWQGETGFYFLTLSVKIQRKSMQNYQDIGPKVFHLPHLTPACPSLVLPLSFRLLLSLPPAGLIHRSCSWTLSSTVSGKKQSDQCEKARGAHGQANQWWKEPCPGPYANGSTSRNLGSEHAH